MRRQMLVATLLTVTAVLASQASAGSAFEIADPTGDANFAGVHGQSLPVSQASLDITKVTFDTVKSKVGGKLKATAIKITITTSAAPSTTPTSSYGVTGTHSACGNLRLQIYYGESGPNTYGDLSSCGAGSDLGTNDEQFRIKFAPKIVGKDLVLQIPLKALPKQFKVGTSLSEITAYTSTAEFVLAGYQPTDFEPEAGIDIATAAKPWKIS